MTMLVADEVASGCNVADEVASGCNDDIGSR